MDDEEKQKRAEKYLKKVEALMAEAGADLIDEEVFDLTKKKVLEIFKSASIPATLSYMKAFKEGFSFGTDLAMLGMHESMTVRICILKMVDDLKNKNTDELIEKSMKESGIK